jgi:hypothetical protein
MAQDNQKSDRQLLELVVYHMLPGNKKRILNDFLAQAVIPACERIGLGPVGVFEPVHGAESLSLFVLYPFQSFDSFSASTAKIQADPEFQKASESFYKMPISDPPYMRMESSLMLAFEQMPKLEAPALAAEKKSRIFEMRIYESHNGMMAKKKVEMFNEGGEIAVFRKCGLQPVFFGETLVGPRMPNLTYMVVFPDWATREKSWETFRNHPDWKKLSADPKYADTVSNITDLILRPTAYSRV